MHNHNHEIAITPNKGLGNTLIWGIVLNIVFVIAEVFAGIIGDSMALLSDAGHNFSDVWSLIFALLAFTFALKAPTNTYTYGYKRGTIVASFLNAIILCVAVVLIIVESIDKIRNPQPVNGFMVMWVAGIGITVNGITTILLYRYKSNDLNAKGAFVHMLGDTLVSVGVLVSGVVIQYTGFVIIDPIISLVIAIIILITSWHLFSQSLRLVLDGVPHDIDPKNIRNSIMSIDDVKDVHHLHIWALSTTENALTAHIVFSIGHKDSIIIKNDIRDMLNESGITHVTLETEEDSDECCYDCCD